MQLIMTHNGNWSQTCKMKRCKSVFNNTKHAHNINGS